MVTGKRPSLISAHMMCGAMVSRVTIDDAAIQGSIRRLRKHIDDSDLTMRIIGIALRDYVRETIRMGGRKRPHAPLSWWTIQRTGRRKPLKGIEKDIHYESGEKDAQIYFARQTYGWNIDMHHKGYNIPARQGFMVVPLAKGGFIFMMKAKAAKVPGREIWPVQKEVRDLVSKLVTEWIGQGVSRSWRP